MFDNLHSGMVNMRNELMVSFQQLFDQKFAVLESHIRDYSAPSDTQKKTIDEIKLELHSYVHSELNSVVLALIKNTRDEFNDLKHTIRTEIESIISAREAKICNLPVTSSPSISHNLVVERKQEEEDTKTIMISEDVDVEVKGEVEVESEVGVESEVDVESEVESEVEVEVESEVETKFSPLEVGDKTYWLDENLVVYKDTEEGYVEIGTYDAESGELDIEDDDEEEGIQTTEFTYKGKTYFRDEDNNVYNADGEEIGIWTGNVVKFVIRSA